MTTRCSYVALSEAEAMPKGFTLRYRQLENHPDTVFLSNSIF
ncbi:MAG: hypothetical protein V7L00_14930 [Nostoc sp.]